jgi:hypothetical protein
VCLAAIRACRNSTMRGRTELKPAKPSTIRRRDRTSGRRGRFVRREVAPARRRMCRRQATPAGRAASAAQQSCRTDSLSSHSTLLLQAIVLGSRVAPGQRTESTSDCSDAPSVLQMHIPHATAALAIASPLGVDDASTHRRDEKNDNRETFEERRLTMLVACAQWALWIVGNAIGGEARESCVAVRPKRSEA